MGAEIRNCLFRYRCPKTWDDLAPTDNERVRFCDQCMETVHYCRTPAQLRKAMVRNQCVAVEIRGKEGELEELPMGEPAPYLTD